MADKNYISHADEDGFGAEYDIVRPPDGSYADSLKFSHATNFTVSGNDIFGGQEDCADFNNLTENGKVTFARWSSGGQYVCTIKGGTRNLEVGGQILTHGKTCDVDLDNWSDQSNKKTSGIRLNFTTADGSAVKVISRRGVRPEIMNPGQKYDIDYSYSWWFYPVMKVLKALHLA